MKKAPSGSLNRDAERDFSKGTHGKYAKGTNLVLLEPDLAKIFPDSDAVNEALRTLVRIAGKKPRK